VEVGHVACWVGSVGSVIRVSSFSMVSRLRSIRVRVSRVVGSLGMES
jgi:hypothetical protein